MQPESDAGSDTLELSALASPMGPTGLGAALLLLLAAGLIAIRR